MKWGIGRRVKYWGEVSINIEICTEISLKKSVSPPSGCSVPRTPYKAVFLVLFMIFIRKSVPYACFYSIMHLGNSHSFFILWLMEEVSSRPIREVPQPSDPCQRMSCTRILLNWPDLQWAEEDKIYKELLLFLQFKVELPRIVNTWLFHCYAF